MRARSAALLALSATLFVADVVPTAATNQAFAADPQLSVILPRGARRGTEATFTFEGNRLKDAAEVLFYEPGAFEVLSITPDEKQGDKKVDVVVKIAPDARVGEHVVQLRTANGLTEFHTIYVGALPEVDEVDPKDAPNTDPAHAQKLTADHFKEVGGVTVSGKIENEDLDHYAIELDAGQSLAVEVEGIRLASTENNSVDPAVEVLDLEGRELAASDDTPITAADPVVRFTAEETGTYLLRIRDAEFKGNGRGYYRMHVGVRPEAFPRPLAVYPAGGPVGEEVEVTFIGDPHGPFQQTVTPVAGRTGDQTGQVYAVRDGAPSPSALPFRASEFPNLLESEPNDERTAATRAPGVDKYLAAVEAAKEKAKADGGNADAIKKAAEAVKAEAFGGMAFNGILEEQGDVDHFAFVGKKGQSLRFDVFGSRLGSPIDPELRILAWDGRGLKSGGDRVGLDAREDFSLPEDGVYVVEVHDHLKRGGENYVYRVEVSSPVRTPTLSIPRYGRYGQGRQRVVIPRGSSFATRVTISRDGLGGDLAIDAADLPEGVTITAPTVPSNQSTWPVLFTAAEDAPLGGTLTELRAFAADKPEMLTAGPDQRAAYASSIIEADLVRYNNQGTLWPVEAPAVAVAVTEKLPFSIEVLPPTTPLVRDGVLDVQIKVHRDEGFEGDIKLEFPQRTPGIGCDYQRTVKKDEDTAVYPLNANDKAALGTFPFYVLAFAGLPNELNGVEYGGGTGLCSSKLVDIEVAETPFTLKLAKGAVQRTTSTAITAELENAEFKGTATVTLKGLPEGLSCEPVEVTAETESFVFEIAATEKAPIGTRKGLLAEVTLPNVGEDGQPIADGEPGAGARVFTAGRTDLRVDDAPKKPEPKTTDAEPKVAKAPEKPKPLSRLERLRREAAGLPTDSSEGDTNR
ncbi:PPC domain-containing protein [Alienimonas sp. DA493]|uniref:PPC domain-containing protein n=1 Tax=Alienimonas sp. DA493 TaxID=3373605 RepID=UPI00375430F4